MQRDQHRHDHRQKNAVQHIESQQGVGPDGRAAKKAEAEIKRKDLRLAVAIDRRLMSYDYQQIAFTNGWRQFESGVSLLAPYQLGPDTRSHFILGYSDAAGTPDPAPPKDLHTMDARIQLDFAPEPSPTMDARSYFAGKAMETFFEEELGSA